MYSKRPHFILSTILSTCILITMLKYYTYKPQPNGSRQQIPTNHNVDTASNVNLIKYLKGKAGEGMSQIRFLVNNTTNAVYEQAHGVNKVDKNGSKKGQIIRNC